MRKQDLTGRRYGRLIVVRQGPHGGIFLRWYCQCDCGKETLVFASALRTGITKSCGCLRGESHGQAHFYQRGGRKESKEYKAWCHAKSRCFNPNDHKYRIYGARGVTMCEEWRKSFTAFFEHMGKCPPNHSLDRIDVNGHYEPGNCRWATAKEQRYNQRIIPSCGVDRK